MYNRYIHQNDGTFQKRSILDQSKKPPVTPTKKDEPAVPPVSPPQHTPSHTGTGSFLRQLLPKEFDTADFMIVLLMLLMAGDCESEKNTALLTLALYFFM